MKDVQCQLIYVESILIVCNLDTICPFVVEQ